MFKAIQILKLWFIINFMKKRNIQIDISYIMLIEYFFFGGGGAEHKVRAWMERQFFGGFFYGGLFYYRVFSLFQNLKI